MIDIIYLTRIHAKIQGDTFFPKLNLKNWETVSRKFNKSDLEHKYDYTFIIFKKTKNPF